MALYLDFYVDFIIIKILYFATYFYCTTAYICKKRKINELFKRLKNSIIIKYIVLLNYFLWQRIFYVLLISIQRKSQGRQDSNDSLHISKDGSCVPWNS